jgi:hypothetical protein
VRLGDVVKELAFYMTLLQRLLVEKVREVDFGFVIGSVSIPEEFTDDSEGHNQQEINCRTFG